MKNNLSELLKLERGKRGLSLRAVATETGVSFSSLARYERGDGEPDHNATLRIMSWLGNGGAKAAGIEKLAYVHFRASKNISSETVELLFKASECILESRGRNRPNLQIEPPHPAIELTKEELEQRAEEFRLELGLSEEEAVDPLRLAVEGVDVERVNSTTCLDDKVRKRLCAKAADEWSAMSVPISQTKDTWVVLINDCHDIRRLRSSLMEEYWHILLGHKLVKIAQVAGSFGRTYDPREEHDAYYLGSATLLPRSAVIRMIGEGKTSEQIAEVFDVSAQLVDYRVKRLGLWARYTNRKVSLAT